MKHHTEFAYTASSRAALDRARRIAYLKTALVYVLCMAIGAGIALLIAGCAVRPASASVRPAPTSTAVVIDGVQLKMRPPAGVEGINDPGPLIVGAEVKPGRYFSTVPAGSSCSWQRLAALDGKATSVLEHGSGGSGAIVEVTVTARDYAFSSAGCGHWSPA